ncbi:hypothetical protein GCM10010361_56300 [Streptomyces olivaceiscleroticus]|uniref:Uncharacterized protein n=1 Tax=Streptomyces olivaceiscleroticus TaxID=68245 RepID=A0ABN1AVB6_9ACTN
MPDATEPGPLSCFNEDNAPPKMLPLPCKGVNSGRVGLASGWQFESGAARAAPRAGHRNRSEGGRATCEGNHAWRSRGRFRGRPVAAEGGACLGTVGVW